MKISPADGTGDGAAEQDHAPHHPQVLLLLSETDQVTCNIHRAQ